jgi:hypothetical protein
MAIIIKKAIIEIRYAPVFRFRDIAYDYFQDIVGDFSQYGEDDSIFEVRSDASFRKIFFGKLRCGVMVENFDNFSNIKPDIDKIITLLKLSNIKILSRVGVRTVFLAPLIEIEYKPAILEFLKSSITKLYMPFNESQFKDFALIITAAEDSYNYSLSCGIVNNNEIANRFSEFKDFENPPVAILNDIDHFTNEIAVFQDSRPVLAMLNKNLEVFKTFVENYNGVFKF